MLIREFIQDYESIFHWSLEQVTIDFTPEQLASEEQALVAMASTPIPMNEEPKTITTEQCKTLEYSLRNAWGDQVYDKAVEILRERKTIAA